MVLSMFGCRAFSMGVTASAKREYSFENAPRCSANSKQIDGRYKTTGIRKKHSGPASGQTLSFDERPSNRSAVGDPCDVQLGPVRPRIISASSNGSSTIPFKNDGRQVTHSQTNTNFRNHGNRRRSASMEYCGRLQVPARNAELEVSPSKASVKQAWAHRRCPSIV